MSESPQQDSLPGFGTVVIGGSAGSLSALQALFEALPAHCNLCFIVIQHMSPEHKSQLDSLIARWTEIPVRKASEGILLQPNHIYVGAAGHYLAVNGGTLHAVIPEPREASHKPIDFLCRSLAREFGPHAAAVVLSGTGSDGTAGATAIKHAGGIVVAQRPDTCGFDGMPQSVMNAGHADLVLAPAEIGNALSKWSSTGELGADEPGSSNLQDGASLQAILQLAREHARNDMSGYKPTTLQRRVERRMALLHAADMRDYLRILREDPAELDRLAKDLLIGVTAFFRDAEAFRIVEQEVVPEICRSKPAGEPVRIWVAGCATGEEAYSIAMLFLEWFEAQAQAPRLQIFATDIDERALEIARSGYYSSAALASVSKERIGRFFTMAKEGYRIAKPVRETIVFAHHNLISDPPFSRLDLVISRNVLIYLNSNTQKKLLGLFHYVLNAGGFLFLGSSESLGTAGRHFKALSKEWRIYRHLSASSARQPPQLPTTAGTSSRLLANGGEIVADLGSLAGQERIFRELLKRHGPALVLIDDRNEVLYTSGDTTPFLEFPTGQPSQDLFRAAKPTLRMLLRSAVDRARREGAKITALAVSKEKEDGVRVSATPLLTSDEQTLLLICFESEAVASTVLPLSGTKGDRWILQQLEQELHATREDLQRTIERTRTYNEELKAANEEVTAMNEELQSANEELESSKEELQSLNEELATSNAALDAKVTELEAVNSDLNNLILCIDTATLLLDDQLRIRRFTPACAQLLRVIPTDVGRALGDIVQQFDDPNLAADCREVLAGNLVPLREIEDHQHRWYLRRTMPYRNSDGRIAGVVLSFPEITFTKQANQELTRRNELLQWNTDLLRSAPVLARDMQDRIVFWNSGAERQYGWSADQAMGRISHDFLRTRFSMPLEEIKSRLLSGGRWCGELVHHARNGEDIVVSSQWTLVLDDDGQPRAIVEVNNDITERSMFQSKLDESRRSLDYMTHFDPLTQLPNRRMFREALDRALERAGRNRRAAALLLLDLDRFKLINESLGHAHGDQLLTETSGRLRECIADNMTLARLGGDEFAILVEDLEDASLPARIAIAATEAMRAPFSIDGHELCVSLSIGISLYPDDAPSADTLFKNADAAMFLAKERGRNNYQFFTPELNRKATRMLAIENRLRHAISRNELYLVYQPQIDLATGHVVGVEALCRWDSPDLGQVPTVEFIEIAEDSGLITALGEWTILTACQQAAAWIREGLPPMRVAVNISASQFKDPNLLDTVRRALSTSGLDGGLLELELTERILLDDTDHVVASLVELRRLGLHLSIDDFGTGYSALAYLSRLPLNSLKVPREFVTLGQDDTGTLSVASAIISLTRSLKLTCVVEGIETGAQLAQFRQLGCDVAQGYYFSRPLKPADLTTFLKGNGGKTTFD